MDNPSENAISSEDTVKTIFFIEGNVSSGKTTVIETLRKIGYSVFEEPLETWQNEYLQDGRNILDLFYSDMPVWSFKFEMISMVTRYKQLLKALEDPSDIIFIERSLLTDRYVFALNLYNSKIFSQLDWKIYCDLHDMFVGLVNKQLSQHIIEYIYIQTHPEECFSRKTGRARAEEDSVAPAYFHQLHNRHEEWLSGGMAISHGRSYEVHTIRGGVSREEVVSQIIEIMGTKQLVKRFIQLME